MATTVASTTLTVPIAEESATPTIDFLIANLQQPEIVRLLKARDPNAVLLLRTINQRPDLTLTVTRSVIAELGLQVTDDETAIQVLQETKNKLPTQGYEKLHTIVDQLLTFAQADLDTEIDLTAISQPFDLLNYLRTCDVRLMLLCETTIAHLLATLADE